jgi:hypothetical protein
MTGAMPQSKTPSSTDVALEVTNLAGGLGLLTLALFPLSIPGLLLFIVGPLVLLGGLGLLVALPVLGPLGLVLALRRRQRRRRSRRSPGG